MIKKFIGSYITKHFHVIAQMLTKLIIIMELGFLDLMLQIRPSCFVVKIEVSVIHINCMKISSYNLFLLASKNKMCVLLA